MKTITKFYDSKDKECKPEQAVRAVKLTLDEKGQVVKTEYFTAK